MLTKALRLRQSVRGLRQFSELIKNQSSLTKNVVAVQPTQFSYELEEYSNKSLKAYFDQDALMFPIEEIVEKVNARDYRFFLQANNFLKVVDTLEKYQESQVDLATQEGREFLVFKRQLYQLYQVENRSADEHEAFSFSIERQNLKWLWEANEDFLREMAKANKIDDMANHANLKGSIFKRKTLDPHRVKSFSYFALSGALWAYSPFVAATFGQSLTTLAIATSAITGMTKFSESNVINNITVCSEGEHTGMLELVVSTSPISSRTIHANMNDCHAVFAMSNDDIGEEDVDNNVIQINNFVDDSGNVVDTDTFTLPADAWRDQETLEWVLSNKGKQSESLALLDSFNDLVQRNFHGKIDSYSSMSGMAVFKTKQEFMKPKSSQDLDRSIEQGDQSIDTIIEQLKKHYSEEQLDKMSPRDLYNNFKKFA